MAGCLQSYKDLTRRLAYLEQWRELAIRPSDPFPDDHDLLCNPDDDMQELKRRCLDVRHQANSSLPVQNGPYDDCLEPKLSKIPGAGFGLFVTTQRRFNVGEILCYYYGHVHNYHSAATLKDRSYLMLIRGDVLVDAGPLPHVKARYINDSRHEPTYNVKFVPEQERSAVVAIMPIEPGQELYADYGEGYWSQQPTFGTVLRS
jgi:SET domain